VINFPPTPVLGEEFTSNGTSWLWDGVKWTFVTRSGGGGGGGGGNRLINGDMMIDQRRNGASVAVGPASQWAADRWNCLMGNGTNTRTATVQRNSATTGVGYLTGFPNFITVTSTSNAGVDAVTTSRISQDIEGGEIRDFQWGGAAAKPAVLSFWAMCNNLAGTYSGSVYGGNRSFPFTFVLPTANVWTKIVIPIPGDTIGNWLGAGVGVAFDLGSSYRAPPASANMWSTATPIYGVQGTQNPITVSGRSMNFTGVKLEVGDVETPFEAQSVAKTMADCMRYYQYYANLSISGYRTSAIGDTSPMTLYGSVNFPMMRAAPAVVITQGSIANTNAALATLIAGSVTNNALQVQSIAGNTQGSACRSNFNLALTA
jgi:hypothetical protein